MIIYLSEQMATNVKELAQIAAGWTKLNFHVKYNWLLNIILTHIVLIAYNCLQIPLYHLRSPDLTMWHTALPKGNQPRLNTVIFKNIIKTVSENVKNNDQTKKKNWLWLFNYLHWYTKPCNQKISDWEIHQKIVGHAFQSWNLKLQESTNVIEWLSHIF